MLLPPAFASEISLVIGSIIANRLSTKDAQAWKKIESKWNEFQGKKKTSKTAPYPEAPWPLQSVIFPYPQKVTYGQEELVFWELKLLADDADHGLFLELILPAMEEASYTNDFRQKYSYSIWGKFDIHSIYVARGPVWEPLVSEGRLNLQYVPSLNQWAEDIEFSSGKVLRSLEWITPFDFDDNNPAEAVHSPNDTETLPHEAPTLVEIMNHSLARFGQLTADRKKPGTDVWDVLSSQERESLNHILELLAETKIDNQNLLAAPPRGPGRWLGTIDFNAIPPAALAYLALASIVHIGRHTHYGCGTFRLE